MADNKNQILGQAIFDKVGGLDNVVKIYSCMTRVRLKIRDLAKVNIGQLKAIPEVLGIVEDADTIQVVIGPGKSVKVADLMAQMAGVKQGDEIVINSADQTKTANNKLAKSLPASDNLAVETTAQTNNLSNRQMAEVKAKEVKAQQKKKQKNGLGKKILKSIAAVFVPLIPGMVGAGLIAGIGSVVSNMIVGGQLSGEPWTSVVLYTGIIQKALFSYLAIYCGINAAKEFGGTAVIGGIIGGISLLPGITDKQTIPNIFDGGVLTSGQGGVIGVLLVVWLACLLEKWCRKWVPDSLDIIVTPTIVLIIISAIELLFIMPLAGYISQGLVGGINWILFVGGPISGFILGSVFLPMVMFGLHQILTPIHMEMIANQANTPLLPILAMAGAGQVGAALALIVKCHKNKELMGLIKGALPVGILGIGEPLIYGVTLPLGRPFITACLGGGIGGAIIGGIGGIGAIAIGPSGLALLPLIYQGKWLFYLISLLSGYLGGFILTYFFGIPKDIKTEQN
ncbi:MAG: PTS transporter subunit EIIC [Bifidobacteriaceae bacterium]|jgi:PTS system sucrose-specific IIC component|nr:PTS transporter subunit EIIC [Bifidobacteriaceae bacterium]